MKTLEVKPLKDRKLTVLIVEKEYNEPFWIIEPPQGASQPFQYLSKTSIIFHKFLENLIKKVNPDFGTEELGMRSKEQFIDDNILAQVFKMAKVPFFPVDIDENAKSYIASNFDKKIELRNSILKNLANLSKQKDKNPVEEEYLIAYGQCLQLELEEHEKEASFATRESWIVMGIMDHASEVAEKEEITCIHVCSPEHVEGTKKLLEDLDAKAEVLRLSKKVVSTTQPATSRELENLLGSMQIQVKPIITKTSENMPFLLFYLDTEQKASPFDICMAYDAGYDAVIPYENVSPEDAKAIVQDAIFSREPKAVKHTCFFIGGKDAAKAEEVYEASKGTMFPPFKTSIIVDPAGAYTTAAAMVAKVENALLSHNLGELREKTCAVLGTGAVGQIAAVLLAKMGCNTLIASLNPKRTDGKEYSEKVARLLAERFGVNVKGVFAPSAAEKLEILKKSDVVLCAGGRGTRVIEKELLQNLRLLMVLVDVNTIPPFGVEGLELKDDMKEIATGIFGIGGLAVGDLKHKLEKEILREARSNGKETYDYNMALQIARKLIRKELVPSKMTLTLSYPPPKKD